MGSKLLAGLREALSDPQELISRAGGEILSTAQDRVQAMGLVETGRLYASLGEGHPDNVANVTMDTGTFGSRTPYAAIVDAKRGFMALNSETVDAAVDAVADALLEDL